MLALSASLASGGLIGQAAAADAAANSQKTVYAGTAEVTIGYYDYCDLSTTQRRHYDTRTASMPVTLVITPPQQDTGGVSDPNPFTFQLATDQQGGEGTFGLQSAFYGTMQEGSGRDVLLVYWTIQQNTDTGEVTAELTDSHRAEGAAFNLIFSQGNGQPCDITSGVAALGDGKDSRDYKTSMRGKIDANRAQLHVEGTSWNGNRDLVVNADLSRR
ncbi:hypothetical protein [Streptomyces sp. MK5]|uniref:hypothetical protein n=1 Tax=Streptomyces sp. MK5 TaxID=3064253 RepID=UPI002740E60A|nr:hypothetical protein [Streptomyces sp. MK5]